MGGNSRKIVTFETKCLMFMACPLFWISAIGRFHCILNCGTNDSNYDRTSSQITGNIIDFALLLKSDRNKFSFSLLTPQNDKLNDIASEVNNRLMNVFGSIKTLLTQIMKMIPCYMCGSACRWFIFKKS